MPAKSERQRRAAGMALAAKRGKIPPPKSGPVREMYLSMTEAQLEEFAKGPVRQGRGKKRSKG